LRLICVTLVRRAQQKGTYSLRKNDRSQVSYIEELGSTQVALHSNKSSLRTLQQCFVDLNQDRICLTVNEITNSK
jgi:hypothetical protein